MKKRARVYIQVLNQVSNKWRNYQSAPTVDEAEKLLRTFQAKYPDAIFRILNNNLVTHTY